MRCNNSMPTSLFTNIAFQLVFYDSLLGEAVKVQQAFTAACSNHADIKPPTPATTTKE